MSAVEPRHARVFFALWPDTDVRDALATTAHSCRLECGGRATAPEKIHLTLFFVGEVERASIAQLQDIARAIEAEQIELDITELGYWRHNRIVWAAARCPPALEILVRDLTHALARIGFSTEDRPYVPHVTLLRNARKAPKHTMLAPIAWRAREFVLVESVAMNPGSRYDIVARWPLRLK